MIDVELLKKVKKIICHKDCPDGIASAIILQEVLPDAEVIFLQYDTPEHRAFAPESHTLWCDIVPYLDCNSGNLTVRGADHALAWEAAEPIMLDHHASGVVVMRDIDPTGLRSAYADAEKRPGVSGAVLAYEEVFWRLCAAPARLKEVEAFARLVGIRDTWRRSDPCWRKACAVSAALMFLPPHRFLMEGGFDYLSEEVNKFGFGELLLQRQITDDTQRIDEAYRFTVRDLRNVSGNVSDNFSAFRGPIRQFKVVAFEGDSRAASDVADRLGNEADLVLAWHYSMTQLKVSARTRGTFPVKALAERFGGGGHEHSAGFRLPVGVASHNPMTELHAHVDDFLGMPCGS